MCVVITDYIEARYTDASAATLTFTHETWEDIHAQHQKRFSDKKIIGWQHTHPSYGIFLSNYDLFIQENFFNLPFQIAYVIDPVQQLRGFFQWKNGKTVKLHGYYVFDEAGKEIRLNKAKKEEKPKKNRAFPVILSVILGIACLGLGIYCGTLHGRIAELQAQSGSLPAPIVTERDQLKKQVSQQEQTIGELKGQLKALEQQLEENQPEVLPEGTVTVRFVRYTVQPGDSLSGICKALGIDYGQNKALILGINGIQDPNHLYPGQELLLPN
jgi:LysM repeat protein/proteasome lid subunit RPN8/RPN11